MHIENPAGVASKLSTSLNEMGVESKVLISWPNKYQFPVDYENIYHGLTLKTVRGIFRTIRVGSEYDLLHVHTGINWKRADILTLAVIKRKPLVVHYHGSESRLGYGRSYPSLAKAKVVSTPDLLRYWPDATYIPNPVEITLLDEPLEPLHDPVRLVHLPTNRLLKGTDKIMEAVESLRKEGIRFDFQIIEDLPHREAIDAMRNSDVVIDWISDERTTGIQGIFGTVSIEALALGKVAIAFIDADIKKMLPDDIPIVSPSAPTAQAVSDTLRSVIGDRDRTTELMQKGRSFARDNYHPHLISKRYVDLYQTVLRMR